MRVGSLFAVLVWTSAPLRASDWYVDAVHGDDANTGASPASAWRTITHALAVVPPVVQFETQLIHVATGVYDAALGEVFPLDVERGFIVRGMPDHSTVIDGSGAVVSLVRFGQGSDPGHNVDVVELEHFLLRSAECGVDVVGINPSRSTTVRDLEVTGMSGQGIRATGGPEDVNVRIEELDVHDNAGALVAGAFSTSACILLAEDSRFHLNSTGLDHWAGGGSGVGATYRRCRIERNTGDALHGTASLVSSVSMSVEDSAIVDNGADAWEGSGGPEPSPVFAFFGRCTIANNAGRGIYAGPSTRVELRGCILWGNGDDIDLFSGHPGVRIHRSDIEDGDGAGVNGNFSLDPHFVDTAHGDYRLAWASPCVETGDPTTQSGTLDLARNARPIDGDLDTIERFDVGAYEFAPLFTPSTGQLGSSLTLELWGPEGNATTLYFTRKALVAPQATPFGELDLDPAFMRIYRVTTAGSGPPWILTRPLSSDPAWIGKTFSFQALTDCAAAPLGKAYTNGVQITVIP